MALKTTPSHPWLTRLHFLVRLLGVTGLLAAVVGLVMAQVQGLFGTAGQDGWQALNGAWRHLVAAVQGQAESESLVRITAYVFLAGAGTALLWLLVELFVVGRYTAARR